ncbi:hypothetical protein CHS0354_021757 [Potamilus streckersoni]|nr:hypothetical protein CHS0354_021757 [Potamilus streckersoni]
MRQLPSICGKNITKVNSDRNTNGIDVQMMQTILPSIAGVLVCAILIGFVIKRYKRSCRTRVIDPVTPERYAMESSRPYQTLDPSDMTSERRSGEIHLSDPYNSYNPYTSYDPNNSYHWFDSFIPEYCPSETQRFQFNPAYDVDPSPAPTVCQSTNSHLNDVQRVNALGESVLSEGSSYLSVRKNDLTPRSSEMPDQSDDDREFTDKGDQNGNKPEGEIVLSEDGSYLIVEKSVSTPDPSAMPRVYDGDRECIDRAIPRHKTHQEGIASSEGSSYESVQPYDSTTGSSVMAHPSYADREFIDRNVSSEDSAFVVVEQSGPLFHPYISGNGPWRHKVIFNINEHYFP